MVGKVRTVNPDVYVRRCVACGYDGALLQNGRAEIRLKEALITLPYFPPLIISRALTKAGQ